MFRENTEWFDHLPDLAKPLPCPICFADLYDALSPRLSVAINLISETGVQRVNFSARTVVHACLSDEPMIVAVNEKSLIGSHDRIRVSDSQATPGTPHVLFVPA